MAKKVRSPKPKHIPQRTCIACRQVAGKRNLVRVVRTNAQVARGNTMPDKMPDKIAEGADAAGDGATESSATKSNVAESNVAESNATKPNVAEFVVVVDPGGKLPGRGAYLHPYQECWQAVLGSRRLEQALRTRLSAEERARLEAYVQTLPRTAAEAEAEAKAAAETEASTLRRADGRRILEVKQS